MDMEIFQEFSALPAEDLELLGGLMIGYLVGMLLGWLFSIAMYVFQSLGVYSIAKRRGIHHPWLSWIPVANMWILGSISDQYQYVAKGKVKNRRKTLLGLQIAMTVCMILFLIAVSTVGMFVIESAMTETTIGTEMIGPMLLMMALYFVMLVVSIVLAVFQYIACYDLFASCNPGNSVLFLVLSIVFPITMPFFIFALRKKDEGMPPRRPQPPAAEPVYERKESEE